MQDFWGDEGWGDDYSARYYVTYTGDAYYCVVYGNIFQMTALCDPVELKPKNNKGEIPIFPPLLPE